VKKDADKKHSMKQYHAGGTQERRINTPGTELEISTFFSPRG